ncbi:MAG TPA: tetratricopeptide repeat protein [Thermoanaerobaculia bacterium]|nr:tetratricopeptide repeat protein [Thermoanaerobaculia bacterium]
MIAAPTDWVTAIAILGAGLIAGLIFVFYVKRKPAATLADDLVLRDLEAKRDTLIEELRAPGVAPEEQTRLEIETAKVLRELDQHKKVPARGGQAPSPVPAPAAAPAGNRAALTGFAWGAGSVLVLVSLGYFVMNQSKARDANAGMTGGPTNTMAPAQAPADPAVQRLEASVKSSPDDLNMRLELAKAYLERDNLMGVFDQTQYVLAKSPNDTRALTYQALVRMAMGQSADAEGMLEKATKLDPSFIDAQVALAWVKMTAGKPKEAEAAIRAAEKTHPEEKARLEQVFAQMKAQGAQQTKTAELPPDHPALPAPGVASAAPAAAPVPHAGVDSTEPGAIHITVDLAPSAKSKQGVLFVMARAEGVTTGPPLAVKRLGSTTFPIEVDLSSADSMMGQPLPPKVRVEARLVAGGNVMERSPNDAGAVQDSVPAGSKIKLALK